MPTSLMLLANHEKGGGFSWPITSIRYIFAVVLFTVYSIQSHVVYILTLMLLGYSACDGLIIMVSHFIYYVRYSSPVCSDV
jgi:hypothetical protein